MEWVKTTAKTLPEAIDLALDNLGVDEAEAEIVVIEEPRPGLFGRMRGTARVEARVKPKPIRPKNERNRNRRSRNDGGKGGRNRNRNKNRSGGGDGNQRRGRNEPGDGQRGGGDRSLRSQKGRGDRRERQGAGGGGGGAAMAEGRDRSDRKSEPGRARSEQGSGRSKRSGRGGDRANERRREEQQSVEESPVEEVATHLEQFLSGLTEAFGFEDGVTIDDSEEEVLVGRIEGQHGLMVGPKGRTLDAVQELARISCQRSAPSSIRIKVDVGGYRQQRAEALGSFARKAADKAVADQVEVELDPMSAGDRKSIHDALNEDDRVETRSVGNDPRRRVLVVPLEAEEGGADDTADDDFEDEMDGRADDAAAEESRDGDTAANGSASAGGDVDEDGPGDEEAATDDESVAAD